MYLYVDFGAVMRIHRATELGQLLRERRRQLRLPQAQLAEQAGVSRAWLLSVEQGHERVELGLVFQLLSTLGMSLDVAVRQPIESEQPTDLDALLERHRG
jgi:y4mF family transcriptional regulator